MLRFSPWEGAVHIEHRGTAWGDASMRAPDALDKLLRLRHEHDLDDIVMPQLDFRHHIEASDSLVESAAGIYKTRALGDGFHLERPRRGVFIANGDCSVGVMLNADRREAVVMHLGLGCLWRSDGGPTLIEQAVHHLGGPSASLRFWVGCGIGPCCHGYGHDRPEHLRRAAALRELYGADVIGGAALHGPRRGQVAYDHVLMGMRAAERAGVKRVEADRVCRACVGLEDLNGPGYGDFYSNTRDASRGLERNSTLVWLSAETS